MVNPLKPANDTARDFDRGKMFQNNPKRFMKALGKVILDTWPDTDPAKPANLNQLNTLFKNYYDQG